MIPKHLVRDVELLCLDAGNTIVFFDHHVVAQIAAQAGFFLDPVVLEHAEGAAKRQLEQGVAAMDPPPDDPDILPTWGAFIRTTVRLAGGLTPEQSAECTRALWRAHREFNLWRRVPPGLTDALATLRAAGVRVCVVSNSEGQLQSLFDRLELGQAFDRVLDSQLVGVEKPDPRIFQHALDAFGVAPARALHLGDVFATDVVGARAAGVRAALIDPFGHYTGRHLDVPRVAGVAEVAGAILAERASE